MSTRKRQGNSVLFLFVDLERFLADIEVTNRSSVLDDELALSGLGRLQNAKAAR